MKYQVKESFMVEKCSRNKYRQGASQIKHKPFKFKLNEGSVITINKIEDENGVDFVRIYYGDRVGMTYDLSMLKKLKRVI